jgi:serine/threonine protein phosphatase PrpC
MGTYLSTPVTEKNEESGESLLCPTTPVAWGVVDMQGWRKSMEDAHVAQTDIDVPIHHWDHTDTDAGQNSTKVDNYAKVFGVFDGHGGPEVARFCQLYLVSVLTQQPTWREEGSSSSNNDNTTTFMYADQTDVGQALVSTFHCLDRMIDDPSRR